MARKKFDIPEIYQSPIIRKVKDANKVVDPRKKDVEPTLLDFGPVRFYIPRHFGFCYGVENAIDIAYKTVAEHPDRNIYLLSEMIHNPTVNEDLQARGVQFLFKTDGTELIPLSSLDEDDIVIVPAFGTTLEMQEKLKEKGIDPYEYNTTCPFVEKVWRRGQQLGDKGYSLVIHGKHQHEETRATFSHSSNHSPSVVVLNPEEAEILAEVMTGDRPESDFEKYFGHKSTEGFDPLNDLERFGVINQTTMLATETKEVMEILKEAAAERYGEANVLDHFADTSDTLCYATNENQSATIALTETESDLAVVVGGYNSSNTMHLVEILEKHFPTYHVRDAEEIKSPELINHFNQWVKKIRQTKDWLPTSEQDQPVTISLTSGASCPDVLVDEVLLEILSHFEGTRDVEEVIKPFEKKLDEVA
ncbi:4-hydroxy-3-methylbut-2-enyl diphosphate reductase [Aliifodinibius sp. S!AR15-10]|uniref:4-hydroxy-3-methylbut-2-enyl diphosphate reductase n=1 Tax=Aliifodinibius sp. S!AR15-10 TaxID=2950437 RepID=UPI00285D4037|nr:4-hydroxy-3-methylbut-2-enyl diphosphate reductase [Aliifodinibius sp. S!AR15-10]MDR8393580.1 4-hydroxy-3-methylbut-2-enyl diphosphate reductase [Aliifodinibius sp. S!AR15-10]